VPQPALIQISKCGRLALNKQACLHQCMGKQSVGCSVLHHPGVKPLNFYVRICTVSITTTILQQTGSCKTSTKCNFSLPTVLSSQLLTFFNNFLNEYFFWRFLKFIKLPLFCWQCWVSSNRVLSYLTAQNINKVNTGKHEQICTHKIVTDCHAS